MALLSQRTFSELPFLRQFLLKKFYLISMPIITYFRRGLDGLEEEREPEAGEAKIRL